MSNDIAKNLLHLLKLNDNLSISELARKTNIPQPTLHHLLTGVTKKPRQPILDKLAAFFNVSTKQLTGEEALYHSIPEVIKQNLGITTAPIIEWDMLKTWPHTDVAACSFKEIILDRTVTQHAFCLIAQEDHVEPIFPKNALLIFDAEKTPADREFVLASINNEIVFDRLFIEKNGLFIKRLEADENLQLLKIKPDTDKVLGTLIEVRLQF